jgi:hypothetical protein
LISYNLDMSVICGYNGANIGWCFGRCRMLHLRWLRFRWLQVLDCYKLLNAINSTFSLLASFSDRRKEIGFTRKVLTPTNAFLIPNNGSTRNGDAQLLWVTLCTILFLGAIVNRARSSLVLEWESCWRVLINALVSAKDNLVLKLPLKLLIRHPNEHIVVSSLKLQSMCLVFNSLTIATSKASSIDLHVLSFSARARLPMRILTITSTSSNDPFNAVGDNQSHFL